MTHYTDDPEKTRAAVEKGRETRAKLGPRLGRPQEAVHRPEDFFGSTGRFRKAGSGGKSHPTRDAA